MNPLIEVDHLTKKFQIATHERTVWGSLRHLIKPVYREITAVDQLSFTMQKGELVGYLGPNGAGKSTTIKMLTGLLVPSSGSVLVDGMIPWKQRTKYVARIGAVFGQRSSLWWDLPVIDSLELLRSIYQIPAARFRSNLAEYQKMLELDEFMRLPVRSLSLGQRMRAELCAALLHDPHLLFLDEPTIGLDVVAKERIRRFIQAVNRDRETTIILTTHDLSDIERLCKRVIILDHGHILYDGLLQSLLDRFEEYHLIRVTFAAEVSSPQIEGLILKEANGIQALYAYDHKKIPVTEALRRIQNRVEVVDFEAMHPDVEDTIRRIYEERLLLEA